MTDEERAEYMENNKKINELLLRNEQLIRNAGYTPPVNNFTVNRTERIIIPKGYVRKPEVFRKLYHLNEIVKDENTKSNISYALQLSDFYNFLINRFNIWGAIESMLCKQAFVNLMSIIEALILECANNINAHCKDCKQIGKCKNNICKSERNQAKLAIEKLADLNILQISEGERIRLKELFDLRNKIHIRLNTQNEYLKRDFNMLLYNEAIWFLKRIDKFLFEQGVPLYSECLEFVDKNEMMPAKILTLNENGETEFMPVSELKSARSRKQLD